jgi:NADH-quinone oxidoreductase subunit N
MFIYDSLFDYFHYLRTDYNSIIELVILLISSIILFYTYNYNKCIGIYSLEYYIITLFCICSFCLFIHCNNIIFMYVLIELQSIGSYVLAAIYRNNRYSIEAGLKYFIIGSFSSIIILFGLSLIYGFSGLVLLDDISLYVRGLSYSEDSFSYSSLLFALTFFNIGFLFKIYAAPFHF